VFDEVDLYITHIQVDEINQTKSPAGRKESLLRQLKVLSPEKLNTKAVTFPIQFGAQEFGDGTHQQINERMNSAVSGYPKKKRIKKEKNNWRDALIIEAALKYGLTLVTTDNEMADEAREHCGIDSLIYIEFKEVINAMS